MAKVLRVVLDRWPPDVRQVLAAVRLGEADLHDVGEPVAEETKRARHLDPHERRPCALDDALVAVLAHACGRPAARGRWPLGGNNREKRARQVERRRDLAFVREVSKHLATGLGQRHEMPAVATQPFGFLAGEAGRHGARELRGDPKHLFVHTHVLGRRYLDGDVEHLLRRSRRHPDEVA